MSPRRRTTVPCAGDTFWNQQTLAISSVEKTHQTFISTGPSLRKKRNGGGVAAVHETETSNGIPTGEEQPLDALILFRRRLTHSSARPTHHFGTRTTKSGDGGCPPKVTA